MPFQGGAVIGPYTLRKSLSEEGGMSQVFLASDTERPDRYAVIKVQLADEHKGAAFQDLLRQEAQLLRRVRHPGVIRIYPLRIDNRVSYVARAYDYANQPWYFAMEYVSSGKTLDKYLKRIKKFPVEWGVELFYQLLVTIEYLHQQGYAHCDLKPQNVILRRAPDVNEVPEPVLIDFGSAAIIRQGIKQLSASIRYSPPEVVMALERSDINASHLITDPAKIDVWALGAILFEIVTGRPLIQWQSRSEITTTIMRERLDTIRTVRPDVHPSLDKLLSVMLRRNPSERPEIGELIRAVEERISSVRPPRIAN
jgi:serine/threonine protein kinase